MRMICENKEELIDLAKMLNVSDADPVYVEFRLAVQSLSLQKPIIVKPTKTRIGRRSWTKEQDIKLWALHTKGKSFRQISLELGRTKAAVTTRYSQIRCGHVKLSTV